MVIEIRTVGVIFSIIGSGIILIMAGWMLIKPLLDISGGFPIIFGITSIILLIMGLCGFIEGISLLTDKTAKGELALFSGIINLIVIIYLVIYLWPIPIPIVYLYVIPPIILVTGGLLSRVTPEVISDIEEEKNNSSEDYPKGI